MHANVSIGADAVLSTKNMAFSIINFKVLFTLVFVRTVFTALQMVFAFHGMRNRASSVALYTSIFVLSFVKILDSHKVGDNDLPEGVAEK